jgi:hypothetical protein
MTKLPRSRPPPTSMRRRRPAKPRPQPAPAARTTAARPRTGAKPVKLPPPEAAPGLPRLALHGAAEAAKLPFKLGTGITLGALDAVVRGLWSGLSPGSRPR